MALGDGSLQTSPGLRLTRNTATKVILDEVSGSDEVYNNTALAPVPTSP